MYVAITNTFQLDSKWHVPWEHTLQANSNRYDVSIFRQRESLTLRLSCTNQMVRENKQDVPFMPGSLAIHQYSNHCKLSHLEAQLALWQYCFHSTDQQSGKEQPPTLKYLKPVGLYGPKSDTFALHQAHSKQKAATSSCSLTAQGRGAPFRTCARPAILNSGRETTTQPAKDFFSNISCYQQCLALQSKMHKISISPAFQCQDHSWLQIRNGNRTVSQIPQDLPAVPVNEA